MGRIPEELVEKVKATVNLEALIRSKGIELHAHGENLVGRCPFHEDKTPSLIITPSKNLWHCMGACQTGGSVIDWVMKIEKVHFRHAVELLLAKNEDVMAVSKLTVKSPKLPSPVNAESGDQELLQQTINFYHETLKERAPEAIKYLEQRGINNPEAIDKFKLGFANRTFGIRLPESRTPDGAEIRNRLQEIGVFRETGHELFNGSLVIPIINGGEITEIYGRKILHNLRPGTIYHTYLPGPHKGIFNLEGLSGGTVILCEALIDALSFWVNGFRNVTASYGVEGFTKDHFDYFKKYNVKRVYIAYDRDEAGDAAAIKLSKKLIKEGIESLRIKFPRGMDANDYVCKMKPADKALKLLIQSADFLEKLPENETPQEPQLPPIPTLAAVKTESTSILVAEKIFRPSEPPKPATPPVELKQKLPEAAVSGEDLTIRLGDREYRIRGLKKNLSYEVMRVNLRVFCRINDTERFYVDTLDLYQARQRASFVYAASKETLLSEEILKADLGKVLLKLEELQDIEIRTVLHGEKKKVEVELTPAEKEEALALLRSPNLLNQILIDFAAAGVVGEEANKLVGYLAAVSRKLEDPLAVIIQSASSAGKSSLMEAVLAMMPTEDKVKYSAMTGQSLFYMGERDLKNKILAISEEEGAQASSYALKLLQSEGEISIASTGKNSQTGKLVTHEYRVEGPVMIFLTTTAVEVDEELLNRAILLTVNETREQTRLIHERQRQGQTLQGLLLRQQKAQIIKKHQNAQRLLRPLLVANPFAEKLTFLDNRTRTRRDHMKYLTLIRSIALLHQHQREIKFAEVNGEAVEYIEVQPSDIEIANTLCHQVLGRSLDELSPQTRKLLLLIEQMVESLCKNGTSRKDVRFSRRQVREWTNWTDFQVQEHIKRLTALEYVLVHRGGRGQTFVYELVYEAINEKNLLMPGLVDPKSLSGVASTMQITQNFLHLPQSLTPSNSPHIAHFEGGYRSSETQAPLGVAVKNDENQKKAHIPTSENPIVLPKVGTK